MHMCWFRGADRRRRWQRYCMTPLLRRRTHLVLIFLSMLMPAMPLGGEQHAATHALWSPPFARPFEVSAPFRAPEHEYATGHRGVDVSASSGEAVAAPAVGVVSFAGPVAGRHVISIRVDEHTVVSLEPIVSELRAGEPVTQGVEIGTVGVGGHCKSECLHIGVRVDGVYVNPLRFYLDKPVLVPWR